MANLRLLSFQSFCPRKAPADLSEVNRRFPLPGRRGARYSPASSGASGEIGDAYLSRCGFGCGSGAGARPAGEHAGCRAALLLLLERRPAVGVPAGLFRPKLCAPLLEALRPLGLPLPLNGRKKKRGAGRARTSLLLATLFTSPRPDRPAASTR